jgi:uncharacterized membrane protein
MSEFLYFLGRFHVLALHLPIGIILAAVAVQWLGRKPRYRHLAAAGPFLWGAAALTAIVTVILGYLHFAEGGFSGPSASAHRLYGTSVAVVATAVWWVSRESAALYRPVELGGGVLLLALVTITGHYGGNLTHGSTFLIEYAPAPLRALLGAEARRARVANVADADPYHDVVAPILQTRCSNCHNDDKRNAEFSMASYASTLAGGETGRAIVPGNAAGSELYRRISLPHDDEEFMPAEGKTPLTAEQTEILRWWIDAGAPVDTTLAAVGVSSDVQQLLAAELGLAGSAPAAAAPVAVRADPQIVAALFDAGFLARPVSQTDPRLIVSVHSPGATLTADRLAALGPAAGEIVELDLHGSGLEDATLAGFERFTQLTKLRLSDNRLTDDGLESLARLPKLESLNLYANSGITDAGLRALARSAALKRLYLWETGVSEAGVAELEQLRPDLAVQMGAATPLTTAIEPGN